MIICIFAPSVSTKPLNDAQMRGAFFVYIRSLSKYPNGKITAQRKYHGERLETLDNIVVARTCLEGNTHRLADVGNRGQRPR